MLQLDDQSWFDMQFDPAATRQELQIPLPDLPPDEVQLRFTGRATAAGLKHAFDFYTYVKQVLPAPLTPLDTILDFGGGWGRIARFFLKDVPPENIYIVDCLSDAIHWLKETNNPCNIVHADPLPPLPLDDQKFSLIYAFSVFSHLSEEYLERWLGYFHSRLAPGGRIIFTSRAEAHLAYLRDLREREPSHPHLLLMPELEEIEARFRAGEFQFYPMGGGGELSSQFYGEAFIPVDYLEKLARRLGLKLESRSEEVPGIDQTVFVLSAAEPWWRSLWPSRIGANRIQPAPEVKHWRVRRS